MQYRNLMEKGKQILSDAGIEEAELDALLLLEYICGTGRNELLAHGKRDVESEDEDRYMSLIEKRAAHIPLQYLTGSQNFMGLDFEVNEHVFIPRQDTEILVEEVMKNLHDGMRILDMCSGSGCILISLLRYSNDCIGVGVDISEEAIETAEKNEQKLLRGDDMNKNVIRWICGDLFDRVDGKFDIIVSNPPYIKTKDLDNLMSEVKDHEPIEALDGKEDGLYFYREIITDSKEYLTHGGMLFVEIGFDQGEAVSTLMKKAGFWEVTLMQDYAGLDRVVYGTFY